MSKWYKLDNAAKIFPPSRNKYDAKIFRFSVSLKEEVDKSLLEEALNNNLIEFPVFKSVLKKGFFWYYLEESNIKPIVVEEKRIPCSKLETGLLFQVSFYKKRINLEVDHALTDGTGTLMFLKSLIGYYLQAKYKVKTKETINFASTKESSEDSFKQYKTGKIRKARGNSKIAYQIKDDKKQYNNLKVIEGIISVSDLSNLAKKMGVTITVYLTSVLIKSIGESMNIRERKKMVVVTIPVNLRNYYPSNTVRNFFSAVSVVYKYNGESIDEIAEDVKEQFQKNLAKENIENKMNNMATLEDIFILRLVPLFLKDFILKIAYNIINKYQTMTLSNIGIIKMPEEYQKYIDYFDVFISTSSIQLCMCSFLDKMLISFTSQYIDSEIEKNFFRILSQEGLNVTINTNKIGGADL